ncbi:MAG: hypothetical protein QMC80_03770, partial [Thermoplasmatales archaeon]|nr:hypothetical protein [Thermoplasmatales archaeon]
PILCRKWDYSLFTFSDNADESEKYISHYARAVFVLQSCYSGYGIQPLSGENRIVISASKDSEQTHTELDTYGHWAFIYEGRHAYVGGSTEYPGFIKSLDSMDYLPESVGYAFDKGYDAARMNYSDYFGYIVTDSRSTPQIDKKDLADDTYL